MKKYIYLLVVLISLSCKNKLVEKEKAIFYLSSSVKKEKIDNVIDDNSTTKYTISKGNHTVLEYIKYYDEKNSIDEEFWSKILMEFDESNIEFNKVYSYEDTKLDLYLQSGSFEGKIDFNTKSGEFLISKNNNSFKISVTSDITGISDDEINLVFIRKGDYTFNQKS